MEKEHSLVSLSLLHSFPSKLVLMQPSLKVSVIPPWRGLGGNALFEQRWTDRSAHSPNTHWLDWLTELHRQGKKSGILFGTADVLSPEDADVLIYMAQPDSPRDPVRRKKECPKLITVFIAYETALGARYALNPKNHAGYDAIFTYDKNAVDYEKYFYLPPRACYRNRIREGLPFELRRIACLVGTNRKMKYRSGLMALRKGWKFSLKEWIDYVTCPGQLITYRSRVGKACARRPAGEFDLYGEGWELLPETRSIFHGVPTVSTLNYIGKYRYYFAFENHGGQCSLVSERIWDALWADTVPVYIGNTKIDQIVPRECFVDAREFGSAEEMLNFLSQTPRNEWEKYRAAGREFIASDAADRFAPESVAREFLDQIVQIARRSH
jgi:hypothetical protein